MTLLQVMPDDTPDDVLLRTREKDRIVDALAACSVWLRHWPVRGVLSPGSSEDEVLDRYQSDVDALCRSEGFQLVDVAQLHPEDTAVWRENAGRARATFLEEHRHSEDEVRFFAQGTGCFYLHVASRVHAVVCEAGDLLSVPAGTAHWFDMGSRPDFCAVRFFEEKDGWVGEFTGDPIAHGFPSLDELLASQPL